MRGLVDHGAWVWPVVLREGDVELRPLRRSDAQVWRAVRSANVSWLTPWEATHPDAEAIPPPTFGQMVRSFNREARSGRMLPLAVTYRGELVGQLTVSGIAWGSLRSAHAGYRVDRRVAGKGGDSDRARRSPWITASSPSGCTASRSTFARRTPRACAWPTSWGSVLQGLRPRFLHIDGAWRDHAAFALTVEDVPGGLLTRWRQTQADRDAEAFHISHMSL